MPDLQDIHSQIPMRVSNEVGTDDDELAAAKGDGATPVGGAAGQHNPSRKPPLAEDLPFPLIGRWLSAMLRVLSPQIGWLLHERDRVLCAARATDPEGYSEDRSLDIVSTVTFDLDAHLEAVGERTG